MTELEHALALEHAGKLAEARDLVLELEGRADSDARAERARLLSRASELALYADGPEPAHRLAQRACDLADDAGDVVAVAHARTAMARVHLRQHTDSALDDADAALDAIPADPAVPASLRAIEGNLRALVAARRGHVRRALDGFAAAYRQADGDPELRGRVLLSWAVQLRNWGLFAEARRRAERSLELRLELGDTYGAAICYGVLAFVYQRQGDFARERDALAADLRLCEELGGTADVPGLHGRLAGALVGLGKYAGAWREAERAIELENQRLSLAEADGDNGTRVHAYAWREQARVALVQGRLDEGLELATRAAAVFDRVRDGYGGALCRLTEAELCAAAAEDGDAAAVARAETALAATRPVFVRLGAVPEAVETVLIEAELRQAVGATAAARNIVQQVLPMLQQAGLGDGELFRRAVETAQRLDAGIAVDRVVTQAAMLRSLAAVVVERAAQPATVLGGRFDDEAAALAFARAAIDRGAVVSWPGCDAGVAVFLGDGHEARGDALAAALATDALVRASGEVDLEHMWPAGVRARGAAVDDVVRRLVHRE